MLSLSLSPSLSPRAEDEGVDVVYDRAVPQLQRVGLLHLLERVRLLLLLDVVPDLQPVDVRQRDVDDVVVHVNPPPHLDVLVVLVPRAAQDSPALLVVARQVAVRDGGVVVAQVHLLGRPGQLQGDVQAWTGGRERDLGRFFQANSTLQYEQGT